MQPLPTSGLSAALGIMETGGPVVYLLAGLSVVVLTVSLIKLWQFGQAGLLIGDGGNAKRAVRLFRQGKADAARQAVKARGGIRAVIAAAILQGLAANGGGAEQVRAEVMRMAADGLARLGGYLRVLEVIAALAPLLGLFGTVLGMIEAFQNMESAGNQVDPSVLSGGIWLALLTTAVGLAVAVPTVTIHSYFERRIERLAHELDDLIQQFFIADIGGSAVRVVADADARRRA